MYRPPYVPTDKPFLNYLKTWAQLRRLFHDPSSIKPAPLPAHLAEALGMKTQQKLPALCGKGSVTATMEAILHLFIAAWGKADKAINLAIYTTRTSLAKRIYKSDPKTAYRHILVLIEAGFLRGKVQVRGGLQLHLNPALVVFDGGRVGGPDMAAALRSIPATGPVAAPALAQTGNAALRALAALFNQNEKGRKPS